MKKSRFTDSQILAILKQAENGVPVPELCREYGMSSASFYKWRARFGGMDASMMARMKELEKENARLKRMYADVQLRHDVSQEAQEKNQHHPHMLCSPSGRQSKKAPLGLNFENMMGAFYV